MERTTNAQPRTLGEGRFVLGDVVGEGGMATVYRAWDQHRSSWCAVKVLSPRIGREAKMRRRFVTEAQAMSLVHHPHVLRIYDVGNEEGLLYIVMELADGGSLEEWLHTYGPMPPRMALDVTLQICEAIGKAHERGIIHRDIKPQNMLVGSDGICRVSDFGIARLVAAEDYTRTGATLGTVGYSAPEQMSNAKQVDERADVFAIGATLYALLTAQTPLDLLASAQDPSVMDGIPPQLAPFITKATSYRVTRRYRSVEEFASALMTVYYTLPENPPDTPPLALPSDRMRGLRRRIAASETYEATPPPTFRSEGPFGDPEALATVLDASSGFAATDEEGYTLVDGGALAPEWELAEGGAPEEDPRVGDGAFRPPTRASLRARPLVPEPEPPEPVPEPDPGFDPEPEAAPVNVLVVIGASLAIVALVLGLLRVLGLA